MQISNLSHSWWTFRVCETVCEALSGTVESAYPFICTQITKQIRRNKNSYKSRKGIINDRRFNISSNTQKSTTQRSLNYQESSCSYRSTSAPNCIIVLGKMFSLENFKISLPARLMKNAALALQFAIQKIFHHQCQGEAV